MSSDTLDTYRHSGKFTPQGLLLPIATAAIVGFPLGIAYAYSVRWIPLVYVNLLVTCAYGFAFGWLTKWLLQQGRVRNPSAAAACGFISGVIALYWNWNGHVHVLFPEGGWFFRPDQIARAMGYLYDNGSWTIGHGGSGGGAVTGVFLAIVWVAEAATIIGFATVIPYSFISSTPYCETTGAWLAANRNIDTFEVIDDPQKSAELKSGSLQPLIDAKAREPGSLRFTRLCLKRSPTIQTFCTVRVMRVTQKIDKKGKIQETVKSLSGDLVIPPDMFELITQFENYKPATTPPLPPPVPTA